jgi:hypothetical protein
MIIIITYLWYYLQIQTLFSLNIEHEYIWKKAPREPNSLNRLASILVRAIIS